MSRSGKVRTRDRLFPWLPSRHKSRSPQPVVPRTDTVTGVADLQESPVPSIAQTSSSQVDSVILQTCTSTPAPDLPVDNLLDEPAQQHAVPKQSPAFWALAYQQYKVESPKLLESFEGIINEELGDASAQQLDYKHISALLDKKLKGIEDRQWRIKIGEKDITVRDQVKRIVSAVVFAKDFITPIASSDPHAALAWAGVSMFLPLLSNPIDQDAALVDGLDTISSIICRFTVIERIYKQYKSTSALTSDVEELQTRFEKATVTLFSSVIDYQVRATCHAQHSFLGRASRDLVKANDWSALVKAITSHDEECVKLARTINQEAYVANTAHIMQQLQHIQEVDALVRSITTETLAEVKAHRRDEKTRHRSEAEFLCLQALYTTPYENQRQIPERVTGTCKWFTDHFHYKSWKSHAGSDVLWVSADPGCGKSTLAKYLVEEELHTTDSSTTCYFFFKDESAERRSATHAVAAILHQLLNRKPKALDYAMKEFNIRGSAFVKSLQVLWDILISVTDEPDVGPVICILDALDECESTERHLLIKCITSWYEGRSNHNPTEPGLKFIATSRPYADIDRGFFKLTEHLPNIQLKAEWESSKIENEINLVIDQRLSDIQRDLRIKDSTKDAIASRLRSIENKTYLWLSLVLDQIQLSLKTREKELLEILDQIPDTLSKAYTANLSKSPEPGRAQQILQMILCAQRPLSVMEVSLALAADSLEDMSEQLPDDKFDFVSEETIRQLCGFLITITEDSTIQFIHQTAKEFLLSQRNTVLGSNTPQCTGFELPFRETDAHLLLATVCLRTIMLEDLLEYQTQSNPPTSYISSSRLLNSGSAASDFSRASSRESVSFEAMTLSSWYEYATSQWDLHFREAEAVVTEPINNLAVIVCQDTSDYKERWCLRRYFESMIDPLECTTLGLLVCLDLISAVQHYLPKFKSEINVYDCAGQTALSIIATLPSGGEQMAKVLLENGAQLSVNHKTGYTPAAVASLSGNASLLELFLEWGATLTLTPSSSKSELYCSSSSTCNILCKKYEPLYPHDLDAAEARFVLCKAVEYACEDVVTSLLAKGVGRDWPLDHIYTPLSLALAWYSNATTQMTTDLILKGPEVQVDDESNDSPDYGAFLLRIAERGPSNHDSTPIVKALIAKGAKVDFKSAKGSTPLVASINSEFEELVTILIDCGADVNASGDDLCTPLHCASITGNLGLVNTILSHGVKRDAEDWRSATPLFYAADEGHADVVKALLASGAQVTHRTGSGQTPLHAAARSGEEEIVRAIVEAGSPLDIIDEQFGETALLNALRHGYEHVASILISAGADVNIADTEGMTALHRAVYIDQVETVKKLLAAGADVNAKDPNGVTPLHIAASRAYAEIVEILLSASSREDTTDSDGNTPLHCAADRGDDSIVRALLAGKSSLDAVNDRGQTPLHCASSGCHLDAMKVLINEGSTVEIKDVDGKTPLHCATAGTWNVSWEALTAVETLLAAGAKVTATDIHEKTPLMYASMVAHITTKALVDHGADISAVDDNGRTALSYACERVQADTVHFLIENGAKANDADVAGKTPLMYVNMTSGAAWHSHSGRKVIRELLTQGADINAHDEDGRTALSYACQYSTPTTILLLLDHGANLALDDNDGHSPLYWSYLREYRKEMYSEKVKDLILMQYPEKDRETLRTTISSQVLEAEADSSGDAQILETPEKHVVAKSSTPPKSILKNSKPAWRGAVVKEIPVE